MQASSNGKLGFIAELGNLEEKAQQIIIEVDLVPAAKNLLRILTEVDAYSDLYNGPLVQEAIRRYEQYWLPLAAKALSIGSPPLRPALDVYWVWLVHMLAPEFYYKDCIAVTGKTIDHELLSEKELEEATLRCQQIWQYEFPDEPFSLDLNTSSRSIKFNKSTLSSKITYGLKYAIERQSFFFHQVSLPHHSSTEFLEISAQRYKQFLALISTYSSNFFVPTYDIDVMWHVHQIHPYAYEKDTTSLLGHILPHYDTVADHQQGSKLYKSFANTSQLWTSSYKTSYHREGGMFRGDPPQRYLHDLTPELADITNLTLKLETKETFKIAYVESSTLSAMYGFLPNLSNMNAYPIHQSTFKLNSENSKQPVKLDIEVYHDDVQWRGSALHVYLTSDNQQPRHNNVKRSHLAVIHTLNNSTILQKKIWELSQGTNVPFINPDRGDQAVLLKIGKTEWAILIAHWDDSTQPVDLPGSSHGRHGTLTIRVHQPTTSPSRILHLSNEEYVNNFDAFNLRLDNKLGVFEVNDNSSTCSWLESVCLGLGVSLLRVLCQPRKEENLQLLTALGQNIPAATHPNNRKPSANLQLSPLQEVRPISPGSKPRDIEQRKWSLRHSFYLFALATFICCIIAAAFVCPTELEKGVALCYFSIGIVLPTAILVVPICFYYIIRECCSKS